MTRILVVDDDEEVGRLLEHVLLGAQYEVDRTYAVAGASSQLERYSYELVIADARLPDGTGMDVADRATAKGAKALIITGYAFMYPQLRGYDFLMKSVRPDELLREVARLLGSATDRPT
jgi:two-component system, NtrC family, response regulator HydG